MSAVLPTPKRSKPRRARRWRPRTGNTNKSRPERVDVRLSPDEFNLVRAGAELAGVTPAALLRCGGLWYAAEFRKRRASVNASPQPESRDDSAPQQGGSSTVAE